MGHYELEFRVILRDGTIRWISGRGALLPDDKGKLPACWEWRWM